MDPITQMAQNAVNNRRQPSGGYGNRGGGTGGYGADPYVGYMRRLYNASSGNPEIQWGIIDELTNYMNPQNRMEQAMAQRQLDMQQQATETDALLQLAGVGNEQATSELMRRLGVSSPTGGGSETGYGNLVDQTLRQQEVERLGEIKNPNAAYTLERALTQSGQIPVDQRVQDIGGQYYATPESYSQLLREEGKALPWLMPKMRAAANAGRDGSDLGYLGFTFGGPKRRQFLADAYGTPVNSFAGYGSY